MWVPLAIVTRFRVCERVCSPEPECLPAWQMASSSSADAANEASAAQTLPRGEPGDDNMARLMVLFMRQQVADRKEQRELMVQLAKEQRELLLNLEERNRERDERSFEALANTQRQNTQFLATTVAQLVRVLAPQRDPTPALDNGPRHGTLCATTGQGGSSGVGGGGAGVDQRQRSGFGQVGAMAYGGGGVGATYPTALSSAPASAPAQAQAPAPAQAPARARARPRAMAPSTAPRVPKVDPPCLGATWVPLVVRPGTTGIPATFMTVQEAQASIAASRPSAELPTTSAEQRAYIGKFWEALNRYEAGAAQRAEQQGAAARPAPGIAGPAVYTLLAPQ